MNAKVVVSSTWRLAFSPADLRARLAAKGFTGEILGCTPEVPNREPLLRALLALRAERVGNFVIAPW